MKKILSRIALVAAAILIIIGAAFFGLHLKNGSLPLDKGAVTTTAATTEETTTADTTATTKKKKPVATTAVPVIEFQDFSIIDYMPLSLASGSWDIKHCQGIAIDSQNGFIYYSYTNVFVKCDLEGNVVGAIENIEGHLGDICYNESDGMVYASLNPPGKTALYVAIINVAKLNKSGLDAEKCKLIRTVHLPQVWSDFTAKVEIGEKTYSRRYGVSGTDAMCFGPSFKTGKGNYLTVSCGTTPQNERNDNDYQILLQYDVRNWWKEYSQPLDFSEPHHVGPEKHNGKYFVYTGTTNYGVQTMTYFHELNLWLMNVYPTTKDSFQKYTLFIIDGDVAPKKQALKGQPKKDEQWILTLYQDGNYDKNTGIYGWYAFNGARGMDYVGNGLFYIIHPYKTWYGKQTAVAYLYVWDPSKEDPFTIAAGIGVDYTISKKKQTAAQ